MKYFDTHAHYYDSRFSEECEEGADNLISTLLSSSVSAIINVATSPENYGIVVKQASRYKEMYTAIGVHPTDSQYLDISLDEALSITERYIRDKKSKCVALGEIGLDYHWPDTDKEKQMHYFEAQMLLARELDIPVSIHDRDAHGDVLDVIRRHRGVRGVLHSYSGSSEMARQLVSLGYMISFSGTLTFKNASRVREVAASLSRESVLIETDAPYLAPHPYRGRLNHSGYLEYTNAALAEIYNISCEECAALTDENARRFFRI